MRVFLLALLAASALGACSRPNQVPAAEGDPMDPFELQISIGRYGVMLSQIEGLTGELGTGDDPADEAAHRRGLARDLREAAWSYNLQRSRLCAAGFLVSASCGPAFTPVWLDEPADAEITQETLVERTTAVGDVVMPFWNAVCADAAAKVPEEERMSVCPME